MGNHDDVIQQGGRKQGVAGRSTTGTPNPATNPACRACVWCGDEYTDKRSLVVSSSEVVLLFECLDIETCARRISQLRLMGIAGPWLR
jgi:hypothetical protein